MDDSKINMKDSVYIGGNSHHNNISIKSGGDPLFSKVRSAIDTIEDQNERKDLLLALADLKKSKGKKQFKEKYAAFVNLAANHLTLLGPFLTALSSL